MFPRNAASPPRIAVGAVTLIADGVVQTSGVSVVVRPEGGAESAGGGSIAYSASSGIVYYTPTQAETDFTAFVVIAYKAACHPAVVTVITSASPEAGHAVLDSATSAKIDSILEDTGTTLPGLIEGIPKVGSTHRYTQVAQTSTTTDVSIGEAT